MTGMLTERQNQSSGDFHNLWSRGDARYDTVSAVIAEPLSHTSVRTIIPVSTAYTPLHTRKIGVNPNFQHPQSGPFPH